MDTYSDYSSADEEEDEDLSKLGVVQRDREELSLISRLHQQEQEELKLQRGEIRELSESEKLREEMLRRALGNSEEAHDAAAATDTSTAITDEDPKPTNMESGQEDVSQMKARVLPLHALLPAAMQAKVFAPCPDDTRLIVVATNVAETSITIPGIRYVVDCGRAKTKIVDPSTGVSQFRVQWISKASAEQRKGRAGRTGPGHVYRLYSSAFYHNYLPQFSPPEILVTSSEELVLQMKAMGIGNVASFPFPTLPPPAALQAAVTLLENLGAVSDTSNSIAVRSNSALRWLMQEKRESSVKTLTDPAITSLGKLLASFSLSPRYVKMIVAAHAASHRLVEGFKEKSICASHPILSMTLSMIAMLGDRTPFVTMCDQGAGRRRPNEKARRA